MTSLLAMRALLAFAVPLIFTTPALAGGWAVTTVDELPADGIAAGQTYQIGYTIRQHGTTPVTGAHTEIRARSEAGGEWLVFQGMSGKLPGQYVVEAWFPTAGEWSWEVLQGPFGIQPLGSVTVAPPAAERSTGPVATQLSPAWGSVGVVALVAAVVGALVVGPTRRSVLARATHLIHGGAGQGHGGVRSG